MSNNKNHNPSQNLHSIFSSQIVQKYPEQNNYNSSIFMQQQHHEQKQMDFIQSLMRDNQIVEEYMENQILPKRRNILHYDNIMGSQSDNNQVPSRNSSLSSKQNNLDFHNKSFEKLPFVSKKFSDDYMDIEEPVQRKRLIDFSLPETPMKVETQIKDRQRSQKINKIQSVGCNCRKSKCLKMYCECFHLQIFCSQHCNCIGCGNVQPNQNHQQAVIDALTRNPKAFQEQKPAIQNSFTLGVELAQVKKGCKCRKTKCLKKYCQCFNSGNKCGIFCKCQSCQNGNNN